MFYASHGIRVPTEHTEEGRVTQTRNEDGSEFDWSPLADGLLRVRSGEPGDRAYAAVRYRGATFYVDDTDLDSKSTFAMLNLVLALQAGEIRFGGA